MCSLSSCAVQCTSALLDSNFRFVFSSSRAQRIAGKPPYKTTKEYLLTHPNQLAAIWLQVGMYIHIASVRKIAIVIASCM